MEAEVSNKKGPMQSQTLRVKKVSTCGFEVPVTLDANQEYTRVAANALHDRAIVGPVHAAFHAKQATKMPLQDWDVADLIVQTKIATAMMISVCPRLGIRRSDMPEQWCPHLRVLP